MTNDLEQRPTPETDAFIISLTKSDGISVNARFADFARRLERPRSGANELENP